MDFKTCSHSVPQQTAWWVHPFLHHNERASTHSVTNTVTSGLLGDLLISFNRPYCRQSLEKSRDSVVTTTLLHESSRTIAVSELSLHSEPSYTPGKFQDCIFTLLKDSLHRQTPVLRITPVVGPPGKGVCRTTHTHTGACSHTHACTHTKWKHYLPTLLLLVNIKVVFFFFFGRGALGSNRAASEQDTAILKMKLLKLHFPTNSTSNRHLATSPLIWNHVSWLPLECYLPHQLLRKWTDPFSFKMLRYVH